MTVGRFATATVPPNRRDREFWLAAGAAGVAAMAPDLQLAIFVSAENTP
jgi:hypothetical protein